MPFHAVPAAAISEAEVESVVDFLQRPRLVIVHTGPIGSNELLGSESRSARHTRASLASAVGDVQFPTVHIEPGGRRNGSDFYMLAVIGTPSLLDRLLLRPGAQARVVQGRTVSVTVSVTIPVFREADDATADGAKGKGCGKAKGKGKGKGKGAGGGSFVGRACSDDGLIISREVNLSVEVARFPDRFLTAALYRVFGSRPRVSTFSVSSVRGMIIVPEVSCVNVCCPHVLHACVTYLGSSFYSRLLPHPAWDLHLDYKSAAVAELYGVKTGFTVPFRLEWSQDASMTGSAVADFHAALLPLTVFMPESMVLSRVEGGAKVEASSAPPRLTRALVYLNDVPNSGCAVQLTHPRLVPKSVSPRALLVAGAESASAAADALAPHGIGLELCGRRRRGDAAPASAPPAGPSAALSATLLAALGSAESNRLLLGDKSFCVRACGELVTWLLTSGRLPDGEASFRELLPGLVSVLSLEPSRFPHRLVSPGGWAAICCHGRCEHLGCALVDPPPAGPSGAAMDRVQARMAGRERLFDRVRAALPPPPPPPPPPAAAPPVRSAAAFDGVAADVAEIVALEDVEEPLSGIFGAAAGESGGSVAGGPEVMSETPDGPGEGAAGGDSDSSLCGAGHAGGGADSPAGDADPAVSAGAAAAPPGEPDPELGASPAGKRQRGGQGTGPATSYGVGPAHRLSAGLASFVPLVGQEPQHVDLGAAPFTRSVPLDFTPGSWPTPGQASAAASGKRRVFTPVGSPARRCFVLNELDGSTHCAAEALYHAVSVARGGGGFGVALSTHEVLSTALAHRASHACSSPSLELCLRRLAAAGYLHKCDAEARHLVFDCFSVA